MGSRLSRIYKPAAILYKSAVREDPETARVYIRSAFLYIRTAGIYRKIARLYRRGVRNPSRNAANRSRSAALYRFFRELYIRAGRKGVRRRPYTAGGHFYILEHRRETERLDATVAAFPANPLS